MICIFESTVIRSRGEITKEERKDGHVSARAFTARRFHETLLKPGLFGN